jgi:hypothetical protein
MVDGVYVELYSEISRQVADAIDALINASGLAAKGPRQSTGE